MRIFSFSPLAFFFCSMLLFLSACSTVDVHVLPIDTSMKLMTQRAKPFESLLPISIVRTQRGEPSPMMALIYQSKQQAPKCLVVLNDGGWSAWRYFPTSLWTPERLYTFALFHEIGHCFNNIQGNQAQLAIEPGVSSELLADLFALQAFAFFYPDSLTRQADFNALIELREFDSWFIQRSKPHQTAPFLKRHKDLILANQPKHIEQLWPRTLELYQTILNTSNSTPQAFDQPLSEFTKLAHRHPDFTPTLTPFLPSHHSDAPTDKSLCLWH